MTALVVAHPDDEILWLSSVLARVDLVVFCFGDIPDEPRASAGRLAALAELSLPRFLSLHLPSAGAFRHVDWDHPVSTEAGIAITNLETRRNYRRNYRILRRRLDGILKRFSTVYTHNPWGEYGHPEHIQIYRVVEALQAEHGYRLGFSGYIGPRSSGYARILAERYAWDEAVRLPTNRRVARRLRRVYQRHDAWTWIPYHRWPSYEPLYLRLSADRHRHPSLGGVEVLDIRGLHWWPPPRYRVHRVLAAKSVDTGLYPGDPGILSPPCSRDSACLEGARWRVAPDVVDNRPVLDSES